MAADPVKAVFWGGMSICCEGLVQPAATRSEVLWNERGLEAPPGGRGARAAKLPGFVGAGGGGAGAAAVGAHRNSAGAAGAAAGGGALAGDGHWAIEWRDDLELQRGRARRQGIDWRRR